jgi:uncharacterized lipoprotein YehR (DUF1307 family)
MLRGLVLSILALILAACESDSPGPLEGTWVVTDPFPVTVTFRSGEAEAMGATKKVSYKVKGDEVLVTYKEGATKGATFKYTVIDANTIDQTRVRFTVYGDGP